MTDTDITDAIVWPEDAGTGAPVAEDEGDWASAAYHGSMAAASGDSYVEAGMSVTYNPSTTSIDISAGLAFVRFTGSSTVQLTSSAYDEPWDEDLLFMISVPLMSNLTLDASAVNDVYLAVDPTTGDGARYRYGSAVSTPSDPHIKIAEVDTSAETVTEMARKPDGSFETVTVTEVDTDRIAGSFAGTNLSITDGTLNATDTQNTTTTLFLSDYAPGGGVVDTEFDIAISDASPGDRIVFDHNAYELAANHVISKPLRIDATSDSTVSMTVTSNNDAHIEFQGGGTTGTSTTTDAAVAVGTRSIPVVDSSAFAVGDDILIMDDAYGETVDSTIQFAQVDSIPDGMTLSLDGVTVRSFVSGANVYQVDLLDAPEITNLSTDGGGHRHFQFTWCKEPEYRGVSVSEYQEVSLLSLNCWGSRYRSVKATDPTSRSSGHGEPISLYRCSDGYVEGARVYGCRRGIDMAWGTHDITIVDPIIQGFTIAGVSVHGGDHCGHFSIQGGSIAADPDGVTGNCIVNTQYAPMSVEGTHLVSRRAGIHALGPCNASNLYIEPVASSYDGQGIAIRASDVSITNTRIVDPTGEFGEGVNIDTSEGRSISNITVDVDMEYNATNGVLVHTTGSSGYTIDDVRIRGHMFNTGTSQAIFLWAEDGQISNVEISMDVVGPFTDQCIRLDGTGGVDKINLHDCRMESSAKAVIYDRDTLASAGSVHIHDCAFESGSITLSFNGQNGNSVTQDSLFVSDCEIPGSIDHSGVTNYYKEGTLVVAEGSVSLSAGSATVSTGVEQPIDVYLDPSNGGSNSQDVDVVASAYYDSSAGEMVVEITEDSTAVGNPTVGYRIIAAV